MTAFLVGRTARPLLRLLLWTAGGLVALVLAGASLGSHSAATVAVSPVKGATLTQGFGCTTVSLEPVDPECRSGHFHSGVDLAAPTGTAVYAVEGGAAQVVVSPTGYGLHVLVDSGGGLLMLYGHLSAVSSAIGGPVASGTLLGWVGSTGMSTGPHLHFEVRRAGRPVDPMPWLPAYAGGSITTGGDHTWSTR